MSYERDYVVPQALGKAYKAMLQSLRGSYSSELFEETTYSTENWRLLQKSNLRCLFDFCQVEATFWNGSDEEAHAAIRRSSETYNKIPGNCLSYEFLFFKALLILRKTGALNEQERAEVRSTRDQLEARALDCPDNFRMRYLLVDIALKQREGKPLEEILDLYTEAITDATGPCWTALCHESLGHFWQQRNNVPYANNHYLQAAAHYRLWECEPRALRLEALVHTADAGPTSLASLTDSVDLDTVMKSAHAISGEIDLERLIPKMLAIMAENAGAEKGCLIENGPDGPQIQASIELNAEDSHHRVDTTVRDFAESDSIATSIVRYVLRTGERLVLHDAVSDRRFINDPYMTRHMPRSVLCLPFSRKSKTILYLENNLVSGSFTHERFRILDLLMAQAAISLENARLYRDTVTLNRSLADEIEVRKQAEIAVRQLNEKLEERVRERTAQLEAAQRELVTRAHKAGMADLAASTLHNIGNTLNSVIASSENILLNAQFTELGKLDRANSLLRAWIKEQGYDDKKVLMLCDYYALLRESFANISLEISEEIKRINEKIAIIQQVIFSLDRYSMEKGIEERISLEEVLNEAQTILGDQLDMSMVTHIRQANFRPYLKGSRVKLISMLVHLFKNAIRSMRDLVTNGRITIEMGNRKGIVYFKITDQGHGIEAEDLNKIFAHGFTTWEGRNGFGLHNCANSVREMHGSIQATSPGPGQGATFILELPEATS